MTRTLQILERLAAHRKINLERLSEEAQIPKPTLLRFLATLVDLGYVSRDTNDQYSLTLRMFSVGAKGLSHMDLAQDARPHAESLRSRLRETVHMGVQDDDMAMYILKIESEYTIRMYSRVGKRIPLYCTAIGKVLFADMEETKQHQFLEQLELIPYTRNTIIDRDQLKSELQQIALQDFSEDLEEYEEGVRCIAAPIRDYTRRVIAGLSVSWPLFRFEIERRDEYIHAITACAQTISSLLGYQVTAELDQNHRLS